MEIQWDAVAAVGTIGATLVALGTGVGAGRIAKADRRAAIEREQHERRIDRETARLRDRLDRSLAALGALDELLFIPSNFPEHNVARAHLTTALLAMDACPDFVRRSYAPRPEDLARTEAERVETWESLGMDADYGDAEICRRLLLQRVAEDREALDSVT